MYRYIDIIQREREREREIQIQSKSGELSMDF